MNVRPKNLSGVKLLNLFLFFFDWITFSVSGHEGLMLAAVASVPCAEHLGDQFPWNAVPELSAPLLQLLSSTCLTKRVYFRTSSTLCCISFSFKRNALGFRSAATARKPAYCECTDSPVYWRKWAEDINYYNITLNNLKTIKQNCLWDSKLVVLLFFHSLRQNESIRLSNTRNYCLKEKSILERKLFLKTDNFYLHQ